MSFQMDLGSLGFFSSYFSHFKTSPQLPQLLRGMQIFLFLDKLLPFKDANMLNLLRAQVKIQEQKL